MRPSIPTRLWIRRPSPTSARRIYPIKIMALYAVESVIGDDISPPPYYMYYTSGIWHRGAGRRTARIGTSSVPTNRDGVRYTVRSGTCMRYDAGPDGCACLRIGTACVRTDRDDERHGAGPDGERTVGTAFDMRCGYDRRVRTVRVGTTCERDGAGGAGVAGRVHGCCASSRRDRRRRGPLRPTMCETGGLDRGATCERTDDVLLHVAVPHQKQ